ncbi:MAG: phosphatase PAP2 family protein [Dehalogenimonas sp.]|uniref:Phosphatase PAP2 family protein n=1 Tax=Candidatus Dehalogenimonas loeffleri TaxID=3127115 RepID=A0ABZ2J7L5_9CHLR|nr:phosphatase PAP2 family protein [Dehalogenimonas sp.]
MENLIHFDQAVVQAINSLVGYIRILDELFKGLANDYFLLISTNLGLVFLWLSASEPRQRLTNQKLTLQAMAALGIGTGLVSLLNLVIFRPRPFDELPINVLLYQPTDSSFPANSAAILFAVAAAVWLGNRKAGNFFFLIAGVHSFARIYAGMYYPLDIISGAGIGILAALATRWLFHLLSFFINWLLAVLRQVFLV